MTTSYNDLVNVSSFGKKRENFDLERWDLAFYCRDCAKEVEADILNEDTMLAECHLCHGKNVAKGTRATLQEFYTKKH